MSCVDIMTYGKAMSGKWVIRVHVQRVIFFICAEKTLRRLSRPQGFYKMADARTGSPRDVCFEFLFQSMNDFCVVID